MNAQEKIFWSEFLELYESMPCLWKIKSKDYSNRDLKNRCYNKMVQKMKEIDPDANRVKVVKKINIFRSNYKRALRKIKKNAKSGAGVFQSSLWYFEKLSFLEDQKFSTEEECTMDTDIFNTESADEEQKAPPAKQKHHQPKQNAIDRLRKIVREKSTNSDDVTTVLSEGWAVQYNDLDKSQQIFARAIFADVLFQGCMGKLTENTVEDIHKLLIGESSLEDQPRSSTHGCMGKLTENTVEDIHKLLIEESSWEDQLRSSTPYSEESNTSYIMG